MVISHKHKYVYIELPQTACTAVQKELIENYSGEKVLFKHAFYRDFLKQASEEEKKYFVFSNMRNPLDIVVSKYFKYKTDHVGAYSQQRLKKFGKFHKYFLWYADKSRYKFISEGNADFGAFFKKFYNLPYASWSILDHHDFDYLIRHENIQEDFSTALKKMGIEQVRPLPGRNVTGKKDKSFWDYYDTPELKARARKLFSEYLAEWDYEFPEDFMQYPKGSLSKFKYKTTSSLRRFYWLYLR